MPLDHPDLVVRSSNSRSRVSNGHEILPGVDRRSAIARRYRDLVGAIAADQGGGDRMSEARLQLVRRFAAVSGDEASAQPDVEIFRACAPALAATGGLWVGISTGYRKLGLLYQRWRDHYGVDDDDVLVVQGASSTFNPSLNQGMIERAKAADPEAAESEWDGGFRNDISAFLDDATIEAAIDYGRPEQLPPRADTNYGCFVDASGGRHDAYTIAIAHQQGDRIVVDVCYGRHPPFNPQQITEQFADLARQYRISAVTGDAYSAEWVEQSWYSAGISYERSEKNKSEIYVESLPLWARNAVSIPNHPKLIRELRLLERRTSRIGRDAVDHGRNGSDDYANSVVGVLVGLGAKPRYDSTYGVWCD